MGCVIDGLVGWKVDGMVRDDMCRVVLGSGGNMCRVALGIVGDKAARKARGTASLALALPSRAYKRCSL